MATSNMNRGKGSLRSSVPTKRRPGEVCTGAVPEGRHGMGMAWQAVAISSFDPDGYFILLACVQCSLPCASSVWTFIDKRPTRLVKNLLQSHQYTSVTDMHASCELPCRGLQRIASSVVEPCTGDTSRPQVGSLPLRESVFDTLDDSCNKPCGPHDRGSPQEREFAVCWRSVLLLSSSYSTSTSTSALAGREK
jgi:hypothetical protein